MKFETIAKLLEAVKAGRVDESKLTVRIDNDSTRFHVGDDWDDEEADIEIDQCNGYYDVEPLYKLLFPKAHVEWE